MSSSELDPATQQLQQGLVVQANAGTGKTYSITAFVAREVSVTAAPGATPTALEDFLIVTFTNNAASDLRVRVREQLTDLRDSLLKPAPPAPDGFIQILRSGLDAHHDAAMLAIERALGSLDRASISTIHQFCGNVLRLAGLPLSDVVEEKVIDSVIRAVASDQVVNRSEAGAQGKQPVIVEKLASFLQVSLSNPDVDFDGLTTAGDPKLTKDLQHLIQNARNEVRRRLESSLTHDETIRRALTLLEASQKSDGLLLKQVREMYRYCIIDESQDTDKEQWKLFRLLFPDNPADGRALVVVGDPKQSIYAFRGADVGAYLEETSQQPAQLKKELTTNYRSDSKLIDALNLLLKGSEYGEIPGGPKIDYRKVKSNNPKSQILLNGTPTEPMELIEVETTNQLGLVEPTVNQISSLLSGNYIIDNLAVKADDGATHYVSRVVEARDVAILVASGPLGQKIQRALLDQSIPAVCNSTESVAKGATFEAFCRLAKAFERPSDDGGTRKVAMSAFFAVSGRSPQLLSEGYVAQLQQTVDDWREIMVKRGVGPLALAILSNEKVRASFLGVLEGERHLTDFNQIVEVVEDLTKGEPISARRLSEALREISEADHKSNEAAARRVESDDDAVQISTIHSTKGLQYPIVVVVDMWSSWDAQSLRGMPAVIRRGASGLPGSGRVMDVGYVIGNTISAKSPDAAGVAYQQLKSDGDAEKKRLFYVGVTRAQHHVSVIYPTKENLALRKNTKKAKDKVIASDVVGCLDLNPAPQDGSLQGLVCFGGHWQNRVVPPPATPVNLTAAAMRRTISKVRDRTSFTQMKKQLEKPTTETVELLSDEDFIRDDDEFEVAPTREDGDDASVAPRAMALWSLPRGKEFGTALHYVFENLDSSSKDLPAEVARVVDAHVSPAMLQGHRDALVDGLLQVLETPLGALWGDVSLRQIAKSSRLEEARFDAMLPEGQVFSVPSTREIGKFIMNEVAEDDPLRDYAEHLAESEKGAPLHGTLNGSIDVLLQLSADAHRFVISDYKSNWLRNPSEVEPLERYSPEHLWDAMSENHYQLQALIYGVASYRYLRSRGKSQEDANRSIGGFAYLFVRGMIGEKNTPLQRSPRRDYFRGQRYGVSSWSSDPYPAFWSGLSELLQGKS